MGKESVLKKVTVRGTDYTYIEYGDNEEDFITSVDGVVVPVTDESRDKLLNVGGFYADLLTPLREDSDKKIKFIVVLSVTEKGMSKLTGFYFDDGSQDMQVSYTTEPKIVPYYINKITDQKVDHDVINSLEFLRDLGNEGQPKFLNMLALYYNPIAPDDTGIVVEGQTVPYGSTVIIKNYQKMIESNPNMKNTDLAKWNIDTIEIDIDEDGLGFMGTIGNGRLIDKNGKMITEIEDNYKMYTLMCERDNEEAPSFDEFLIEYEKHEEKEFEDKLQNYLRFTSNDGNEESARKEIEKEKELSKKQRNEPVQRMISFNLLMDCIKMGLVELPK